MASMSASMDASRASSVPSTASRAAPMNSAAADASCRASAIVAGRNTGCGTPSTREIAHSRGTGVVSPVRQRDTRDSSNFSSLSATRTRSVICALMSPADRFRSAAAAIHHGGAGTVLFRFWTRAIS
jgi:hypothetical protein